VYTQDFDPVSSSLGLTAIFAALPLIALFLLLGGVRMKAQWAALIALGVAMAVALIVYGMPYNFNWLPAAGTLMLISGLITMAVLGLRPGRALGVFGRTLDQLKWAILTVAAVLALAYVMNQSGQTITLGLWAAGAGGFFAFLSALIGWLGVAVTGSDTSSNALFGALQVTAAKDAGISQTLLAAANSSGGVLGKMISPQNLAIGAAAVGLAGREGDLFRKVLVWSLVLVLLMCAIVYLQSTPVLDWMVV
jgi:lactate permease